MASRTFTFLLLISIVNSQKVSGDVGFEGEIVTANPNPFNIPTINWDEILNNIPTLPPLVIPTLPPFQIPTLDPNFWQNLPTIPPLVLPTLDPNFWQNLPTIPPLVLPTLDPNFWQNLPTIPPLVLPTLDPNFWQNLPTLPPFQLPTLDPNFWQNLPTLAPLPTLDPNFWQNLLQTPPPNSAQCTYKLAQQIQNNQTFEANLNYTNVNSVVNFLVDESKELCSGFQAQKLSDLSNKYEVLISDMQEITPYLSTAQLKTLLLSILNGDSAQVFQIFFSKSMENLANPQVSAKISKASGQVSMLQFDLAISPI